MNTWNEYKNFVKKASLDDKQQIEDCEQLASIITNIIKERTEQGFSQRELANTCHMPQSTLARVETFKTIPSIDTLIRILRPLGLTLSITKIEK